MNTFIRALKDRFMIEKEKNDRGGVFGYTQRKMAYNSNKIEGSTLTERQTASIFETGYISNDGETYRAKDVEEMTGHFVLFNFMLDTYLEPINHQLLKAYHSKLKAGVFEDIANGYPIGDYKNRKNIVSDIETSTPGNVEKDLDELLEWYGSLKSIEIKDILEFHSKFEKIHPFQDGNGRIGRILIFKECLKHDISPFIISDNDKYEYYKVLNISQNENDFTHFEEFARKSQNEYYNEIRDFVLIENSMSKISKDRFDKSIVSVEIEDDELEL
ncbi:MAG: Fic family protein [Anaerovoracaceae bacterium]